MACIVYAFHRIAPSPEKDRWRLTVHPFELESFLLRLKELGIVTSIDEAVSNINNDKKLSVVITFDDGYEDFEKFAAPIIHSLGIPVTLFVATSYVESSRPFWWEVVRSLEFFDTERSRCAKLWGWAELDCVQNTIDDWLLRFKYRPTSIREEMLAPVSERVPALGALTVSQISRLSACCSIANHTHSHTIVSLLKPNELDRDLEISQQLISQWIGKKPRHFAYPNGQEVDQDKNHARLLSEREFISAVTTKKGINTAKSNPFMLNRFIVEPGDTLRLLDYTLAHYHRK